jgi:probable F420-dependent oxidoreductase
MELGVYTFSTDRDMPPGRFAAEVEARGFDRLMFTEHSHIPVARATPYPDVYGGGVLPDFYQRTYDPFIACSFAAAETSRLLVGTGVCLLALRDPIHTAKEVASVDRLSGGRFVFGVGFGWNADEFVNHRASFETRHATVRERVALMRELWTKDVASFSGNTISLEPSWAWPKPVCEPHPPIHVGGNGPRSRRHAARWADGWYPTDLGDRDEVYRGVSAFRNDVEAAGRDFSTVSVGAAPADLDPATLAAYQQAGVEFVNLAALAATTDDLLKRLDALAELRNVALA